MTWWIKVYFFCYFISKNFEIFNFFFFKRDFGTTEKRKKSRKTVFSLVWSTTTRYHQNNRKKKFFFSIFHVNFKVLNQKEVGQRSSWRPLKFLSRSFDVMMSFCNLFFYIPLQTFEKNKIEMLQQTTWLQTINNFKFLYATIPFY